MAFKHIRSIYKDKELELDSTIRKSRIVQMEGNRKVSRDVDMYNLDLIISLGYRVNSVQGTQFRIWATNQLKEYMVKGFVIDDDRLKGQKSGYFEELLERVRVFGLGLGGYLIPLAFCQLPKGRGLMSSDC